MKSGIPAVSPARRAAFDILMAVERGSSHSDDLLRGKAVSDLQQADRNLATALVLGVLRWQLLLDGRIRPLLKRPAAKLDSVIQIALRMGAFQLLFLDRIPARAAIDESVELAKRAGHRFAAGMVNAVLRGMAREFDARSLEGKAALEPDSSAAYPAWMVDRWKRVFGAEATLAICKHGQQPPRLALRLVNPRTEEELASARVRLEPGQLLKAARIVAEGDVTATEAARAGRVRVQDEGSQLIGEIAAIAGETGGRKAEQILDLCAAPGGKTLILAEQNPEAQIVACEASTTRLAALRQRLAGNSRRVECRLADAASFDEEAAFDVVLADVPCSGTGTLGRNPEIRHRLREVDLARQAERQRAILRAALRAVRPGGRVTYSTCSLEPDENQQVVRAVLAENAQARAVPVGTYIDAMERTGVLAEGAAERLRECITQDRALRLMPGVFGSDGFFVTVIERSA
ncbi:MAG: transcription antitermination factor NusB [Terracidiphilus sp.]